MGRATDAQLTYGYDLGGPDEWLVQETDQYGRLPRLTWYDEEDDNADFINGAERHLLAELTGFNEPFTEESCANGYFDRRAAAWASVHVEVQTHCSNTAPRYLLTTHTTTVHRGQTKTLDFNDLTRQQLASHWDDQLEEALRALALAPTQDGPAWLLTSYGEF